MTMVTAERAADPSTSPSARLIFPGLGRLYATMTPVFFAILRIWFGLTVVTHGYPKLFRVPHGEIADPYSNVIHVIAAKLALPAPDLWGMLVTGVESIGGLLLALGLATRIVAPMIAIQMLVIALGVLWPAWAWTEHGMEYPLLMSALAGYFSFAGAGPYSLDRLIGREI